MNPEFKRNLWLEFSLHRLVAAPVVIALVLLLVAAVSKDNPLRNMAQVSGGGFVLAVLFWGAHLAGGSVSTEVSERTWDTQRMSAIGPWTMTWGKLLGAPAFAWYMGLMLLPVFVVCGQVNPGLPALRLALLLVAAAVLLHAVALNFSIYAARKQLRYRGASVLIFVWLLSLVLAPAVRLGDHIGAQMHWWGAAFDAVNFALASTGAFAAWAVLGAYRSMCTALEIRTRPWTLPAFILFSAIWISGLLQGDEPGLFHGPFGVLLCAVAISGAFSYALLLAEPGGASAWQQLRMRLRARNPRQALEAAPVWLVAIATGLLLGIIATFASAGDPATSSILPLAAMLFVVRDAAIFQFFALARQPRRAEATALFYLVVLYGLLPGLLTAVQAQWLAQWVLPRLFSHSDEAMMVMLVQASIAIAVAWRRWKTVHAPDTEQAVLLSRP